jgi:hypothetical protein
MKWEIKNVYIFFYETPPRRDFGHRNLKRAANSWFCLETQTWEFQLHYSKPECCPITRIFLRTMMLKYPPLKKDPSPWQFVIRLEISCRTWNCRVCYELLSRTKGWCATQTQRERMLQTSLQKRYVSSYQRGMHVRVFAFDEFMRDLWARTSSCLLGDGTCRQLKGFPDTARAQQQDCGYHDAQVLRTVLILLFISKSAFLCVLKKSHLYAHAI